MKFTTVTVAAATAALLLGAPAAPASARDTPTATATGVVTTVASKAGSLPVGQARYPIPTGAVYVAPGTTGGTGAVGSPLRGLANAIAKAASGATLVLRAGTYHESVVIPRTKRLTIQNYPGEAVWMDGSKPLTTWIQSGSRWYSPKWTYTMDSRVSFTQGVDESTRWVSPSYPMAGHPELLLVNGSRLRQVKRLADVGPGEFFVDTVADRIYSGTSPVGKAMRASTLTKAMTIHGSDSIVRGIGIRRYATNVALFGAISAEMPRVTLENLVIIQNATIGLFAWATGHRFRKLTVSGNGLMGIGLNNADDFSLTDSRIEKNNHERFKDSPASGGVKMAQSRTVSFSRNVIANNYSAGLWFDMSVQNANVYNNVISRNTATGLEFEASDSARIVGNVLAGNGRAAIEIYDSSRIEVWNNTVVGGKLFTIRVLQDSRRSGDPAIPFIVSAVRLRNNAIELGTAGCPVLVDDLEDKKTATQMGFSTDGNTYHRATSTTPANLACLAAGAAGFTTYKNLSQLQVGMKADAASVLMQGAAITTSTQTLTTTALSASKGVAVPASVATVLGVPTGWVGVGAR